MTDSPDAFFMARAIALAKKGRYTTDPNPRVGCVLVKDGVIIGEGWHVRAGFEHAEINALKSVPHDQNAAGATAYVTLEPCSHQGKTPPCCDALIKANVARVVVAMQDPNRLVSGQGLQKLLAAGIEITCGVLEKDAQALNPGFIKRMNQNRPFVRSKLAMSLDGRTALASGESKWITSTQARADVQRLRAQSSAILTGINTVLADDPQMNVRGIDEVLQPIRVVLDSQLKMPLTAMMAGLEGRSIILTGSNDLNKRQALQAVGFEVYQLETKDDRLDLSAVMAFLAEQEVNEVLVEAGSLLNGALMAGDWVDEWIVYMAPCVLGDQSRGLFSIPGLHTMADKKNLSLREVRQVGPDLKLTLSSES